MSSNMSKASRYTALQGPYNSKVFNWFIFFSNKYIFFWTHKPWTFFNGCIIRPYYISKKHHWAIGLNNRFLRERGMASSLNMEYHFLCIFQKNSAMATLVLKEMGKFLWEGRENVLPSWLSQFGFAKLRQPIGQTIFPTFPKQFFHFLQN